MTRVKKTRSLKRIHKTKTGSISRFKEQARSEGYDRQTGKRVKKKTLSVYEKFLQENPEAKDRQHAEERAAALKAEQKAEQAKAARKQQDTERKEREDEAEDRRTLLDQLDDKDFGDIY